MYCAGMFKGDIGFISLGNGALKGYVSIFKSNSPSEYLSNLLLLQEYPL